MVSILKNEQIDKITWKETIELSDFISPFQSFEFFQFYNSISNNRGIIYAAKEINVIKALCLVTITKEPGMKKWFSSRAIIYGGLIITSNETIYLSMLLNYIYEDLRKDVIFIEIRNYSNYSNFHKIFLQNNFSYLPYVNYIINFQGQTLNELINKMKYNRRREIKLSLTEGATYCEANNLSEVKSLYIILNKLYKERVKLPLPKINFFYEVFNTKIGKIFIVKHNTMVIGGSVCFYYPKSYIYTMYYCGLRDYHKKIFPTHLAILAVIDYGITNNLKGLDLMGAGKLNEEYGVRNYKSEFGGELIEYGRFLKICKPFLYKLGKNVIEVSKRIKINFSLF